MRRGAGTNFEKVDRKPRRSAKAALQFLTLAETILTSYPLSYASCPIGPTRDALGSLILGARLQRRVLENIYLENETGLPNFFEAGLYYIAHAGMKFTCFCLLRDGHCHVQFAAVRWGGDPYSTRYTSFNLLVSVPDGV